MHIVRKHKINGFISKMQISHSLSSATKLFYRRLSEGGAPGGAVEVAVEDCLADVVTFFILSLILFGMRLGPPPSKATTLIHDCVVELKCFH